MVLVHNTIVHVRIFLFFIWIIVAFRCPAVWILWFCRPCMYAWQPDKNVLVDNSFVQCSVDCVNAIFACLHACNFYEKSYGKTLFSFWIGTSSIFLCSYSFTHKNTLYFAHGPTLSPFWDTFFVCLCVCVRFTDKVLKLFGFA